MDLETFGRFAARGLALALAAAAAVFFLPLPLPVFDAPPGLPVIGSVRSLLIGARGGTLAGGLLLGAADDDALGLIGVGRPLKWWLTAASVLP